MWYELIIMAVIMLLFCVFMQLFTVKAMFSLFNSVRPEGTREIKPVKLTEIPKRKTKTEREAEEKARKEQEQFETIMRNLETYDGTGIGQVEVK